MLGPRRRVPARVHGGFCNRLLALDLNPRSDGAVRMDGERFENRPLGAGIQAWAGEILADSYAIGEQSVPKPSAFRFVVRSLPSVPTDQHLHSP